ncbi:MAG: cytochrome c-550 PedF [Rhodobacteraceae bacterium]|nr:cytochrome c-550 PedF [Paracoccaceae bacterium]MBR28230.1 cytochrome c-550 PedF [Paracoccaceae bacterium]
MTGPGRGKPLGQFAIATGAAAALALGAAGLALAHGDVAPQPVETGALPELGEDWLTENPYRDAGPEVWAEAIAIGDSGYNQNCARCHGLGVISGGLAPDLRYLEAEEYGDEWYAERFRTGYTQNGITKMPAFGELLGQKAAWAIRTYIETRPDDGAMDAHADRLKAIRDALSAMDAAAPDADAAAGPDPAAVEALRAELETIAAEVPTASGAPVADSAAYRAAARLSGPKADLNAAAEVLTIGLSAAH